MGICVEATPYCRPENNYFISALESFNLDFSGYCNTITEYIDFAYFDAQTVIDILVRISERGHHNAIFHDMPSGMNETRQLAIACYWTLKYRPLVFTFRARRDDEKEPDSRAKRKYDEVTGYATERFCMYLIDGVYRFFSGKPLSIPSEIRHDLEYAFRNDDISKETMTIICELLLDCK